MNAELHQRAKELFPELCNTPPAHRRGWLDERCGGDPSLRHELESLLEHYEGAASSTASEVEAEPPSIERYRLRRRIGTGGMGEVWSADQLEPLRRRVAVKVLRPELRNQEMLARFEAERQALASMEHPYVATIFDAGLSADGRSYFAMELVEGTPVTRYCVENGLTLAERLDLFAKICRGVQHAHDKGLVHRDLKPSNLLVATVDGKPLPKIIDFGIAKATLERPGESAPRTRAGSWLGTPEYMSPEQADPETPVLDGRSDVYALGVVLYELVVGHRPFESPADGGVGDAELRRRAREREPTPPSVRISESGASATDANRGGGVAAEELVGSLGTELDRIVLKALASRRDRRYESPSDLADDLEALGGSRVAGAPARSALRRVVAISAIVVAALALAAGLWWRGYKTPASADSAAGSQASSAPTSVAVLPFSNLSTDPGDEYLSAGVSEELLNSLSRIEGLRVAARTSSFAFQGENRDIREIAERLGVEAVLEGSLRRSGRRLRVSAQLIDARTGLQLWSESFDQEAGGLFEIQDKIASAVASALEVQLRRLGGDATGPRVAGRPAWATYDAYLRGRHLLNQRGQRPLEEAIGLFQRAIDSDASFVPAYTGLADGYVLLTRHGDLPMEQGRREALAALQRAIQLDNRSPEVHASLGLLHMDVRDLGSAESALRRAIELNPNHALAHLWLGHVLLNTDRIDEADASYRVALTLDPLNPKCHDARIGMLMQNGGYDDAIAQYRQRLFLDPQSGETYRMMALFARTYGRLDDAVRWARLAVANAPDAPLNLNELAMAYGLLGYADEALATMDRAYELAPNNDWVSVVRAGILLSTNRLDDFTRLADRLLAEASIPGSGPLTQAVRVRLVLAARAEIDRENFEQAAVHLERALGQPPTSILEPAFDVPTLVSLAAVRQKLGRTEEAAEVLDLAETALERNDDWLSQRLILPDSIAAIQLLRGEPERALATLVRAGADGWRGYGFLATGSIWDPLRGEEEFALLLARLASDLERMRASLEADADS